MMMQMVAAGGMPALTDGVRGADAANPRGYFEFEPAKRTKHDSAWVDAAKGKAVKMVHLLLPDLPASHEYRVIAMRRDMSEVLASQEAMLRDFGRRGADLPPDRLAEVFARQLEKVREWLRSRANFSVLDVDYREVVRDAATQAARVNLFLGGDLNEQAMSRAVDPTLYRRRAT